MDEIDQQNLENLRHQISSAREQIKRLGESLQSILDAHRTQLENDRSEAIQPYRKKALQALDSVRGDYALVRDQPLKEFEEELEKVVSGEAKPETLTEEPPETLTEEQSHPKKRPRRRRRSRSRDMGSRPHAGPSAKG
jgi:hypothetical protein